MCGFLTLKMLLLAHFTWEFRVFDAWREFSIEKGQFLTNGSKRWRFFVLINARANGNIFRVKKSNISLTDIFFDSPCTLKWPHQPLSSLRLQHACVWRTPLMGSVHHSNNPSRFSEHQAVIKTQINLLVIIKTKYLHFETNNFSYGKG